MFLDQARAERDRLRQQLSKGLDPISEREKERAARNATDNATKARAVTFATVAQSWFDAKQAEWTNDKHRAQNLSTLKQYAFPVLGKMVVAEIDIQHVREALEVDDLWLKKNPTAKRVRLRIEWVLDFAKTLKLREGENPAKWKGNLALIMPSPAQAMKGKKREHTFLEFDRVPAFIKDLRKREGVAAKPQGCSGNGVGSLVLRIGLPPAMLKGRSRPPTREEIERYFNQPELREGPNSTRPNHFNPDPFRVPK